MEKIFEVANKEQAEVFQKGLLNFGYEAEIRKTFRGKYSVVTDEEGAQFIELVMLNN